MSDYYDNPGASEVRNPVTHKNHRIRVHGGVPYITFNRKTRVLFKGPLGLGGEIHVNGDTIHFRDVVQPVVNEYDIN